MVSLICYDFEGDVESLKLQEMIKAQGIEKTLEQVSVVKVVYLPLSPL